MRNYLDPTHFAMYTKLLPSALYDAHCIDPTTGKVARKETQEEWRRGRITRCRIEYALAVQRNPDTMDAADLSPQQCLCFCAAQDEWREATGVYHWELHPLFVDAPADARELAHVLPLFAGIPL
jgi:hypothetical protein